MGQLNHSSFLESGQPVLPESGIFILQWNQLQNLRGFRSSSSTNAWHPWSKSKRPPQNTQNCKLCFHFNPQMSLLRFQRHLLRPSDIPGIPRSSNPHLFYCMRIRFVQHKTIFQITYNRHKPAGWQTFIFLPYHTPNAVQIKKGKGQFIYAWSSGHPQHVPFSL